MELHFMSAKCIDCYEQLISSPSAGPVHKMGPSVIQDVPLCFMLSFTGSMFSSFFLLLEKGVGRNGLALGDHIRWQTFCCPSRRILTDGLYNCCGSAEIWRCSLLSCCIKKKGIFLVAIALISCWHCSLTLSLHYSPANYHEHYLLYNMQSTINTSRSVSLTTLSRLKESGYSKGKVLERT